MPFATTTDGVKLHYKTWGAGRPVILIHGWPLSGDSFDDLSQAVAEAGMRAVAYDRRGFGRSDQPSEGYDYDTFADDLAAVMKQAEADDDAALVGFSMGGGEVARYMSRHAGRGVSQAVLISSVVPYLLKTPDNPHGVDPTVIDKMTQGMKSDRAAFFYGFFKDFYGVSLMSHAVSDPAMEWSRQMAMQAGLRPTLGAAKAFATTDFRPDLASFKVPTLVIHGTDDKTVPIDATGRAAASGIANASFIEYEGAPHGVFASHKARLEKDVLAFLAAAP